MSRKRGTDLLEQLLSEYGAMSSSDLIKRALEHTPALKANTLRQQLKRNNQIQKLSLIRLPHNARIVYLRSQFGDERFFQSLSNILIQHKSSYGYALQAVIARSSCVSKYLFFAICGAPKRMKNQLSCEKVLSTLVEVGLLHIHSFGQQEFVSTHKDRDHAQFLAQFHLATSKVEMVTINAFAEWAKRLNFGSFRSFNLRNQSNEKYPTVGSHYWDVTAPSYIMGISTRAENSLKPGFMVADILLKHEDVSTGDVSPFLRKLSLLKSSQPNIRLLPFYISFGLSAEALKELRSYGVVVANISSIFDDEVKNSLIELIDILRDIDFFALDVKSVERVFERLDKVSGAMGVMRGYLFEYLANDLFSMLEPPISTPKRNINITSGGVNKGEIDAIFEYSTHLNVAEYKARPAKNLISDDEILDWTNKIKLYEARIKTETMLIKPKRVYRLITTGHISEDSVTTVQQWNDASPCGRNVQLELISHGDLTEMVARLVAGSLKNLLQNYMLR